LVVHSSCSSELVVHSSPRGEEMVVHSSKHIGFFK
jgi:hypothetical protein